MLIDEVNRHETALENTHLHPDTDNADGIHALDCLRQHFLEPERFEGEGRQLPELGLPA